MRLRKSLIWPAVHFFQREPQLSLLCGGIAGAVSRTAVSPFERVKVLYQVQGSTNSYTKGTLSTVAQIWREEGYKGLFRGNFINCLRIFPYTAVQYSVYMEMKDAMKKYKHLSNDSDLTRVDRLFGGTVAGFASLLVTYPMDLVKTRLSVQTAKSLQNLNDPNAMGKPLGMWGSLKDVYKNEGGIRGLYRGLMPTAYGVAPYVGLNFMTYETLKNKVPEEYRSTVWAEMIVGALSGGISQTIVYPFDLLRRRFQVATLDSGKMGFNYDNTWHALKSIVAKEGVRGLYKGWQANMWKIMTSMAVQWTCYDEIKRCIQNL